MASAMIIAPFKQLLFRPAAPVHGIALYNPVSAAGVLEWEVVGRGALGEKWVLPTRMIRELGCDVEAIERGFGWKWDDDGNRLSSSIAEYD